MWLMTARSVRSYLNYWIVVSCERNDLSDVPLTLLNKLFAPSLLLDKTGIVTRVVTVDSEDDLQNTGMLHGYICVNL